MLNNHDSLILCHHYLKNVYDRLRLLSSLPSTQTLISQSNGEVLPQSVSKLLGFMSLTANDIFLDLGSGAGKIVAQVFLQTEVKKALGVEIVSPLYKQAQQAAAMIQTELPVFYENERVLRFVQGDFLQEPWLNATVVFINSICFTQKMLVLLGKKINQSPTIRLVLTLRPIPTLTRLSFKKVISVEGSWDSALCYLYEN